MPIHAGISELRQAFHEHLTVSRSLGNPRAPSLLLLFYASECGLKWILLRDIFKVGRTERITESMQSSERVNFWSHDLRSLMRASKISANAVGVTIPHQVQIKDRTGRTRHTCKVEDVHQAWRYGKKLEDQDEQTMVCFLNNLCALIQKK